ncbi:DUF3426 domain-containing protein [Pseudomonas sp. NA-150]|uniref:DUF3426 domain-containing protein n=1 Tax=Pseudomonas sp. NA-150 TaxID=3367525 RepID=UPI0037C79CCA
MTDSFVTQCPHCQTSFRVSHGQLSVARGVVRCGSCLQVFNAAKQLLEQHTGKPAEESLPLVGLPTAPVAPPVIQPVEPLPEPQKERKASALDFDSLDLDNMDLDEELAKLEQREIQLSEEFGRESHGRHTDSTLSARRDNLENDGEQFASLVNDDADEHSRQEEEHQHPHHAHEEPHDEPLEHHGRTEPSLSLDSTALDDEPQAPVPYLSPSVGSAYTDLVHKHPPAHDASERFSAVEVDENEAFDEPQKRHEPRLKPSRNEPMLDDLTDDPLQLDWQKPKPRWGRRFAWGLLVLLALAALAGQYVWYHFDELARQDQYRPWFQQLCPQIGCKVPSKVDINLLRSSNLVVRSHPEFKGALVVDAIIYNRASFSQPFPLLELRFADPNGQLIASRRFKPSEYLSGEMAGKSEMPPQTPIHIALDILDPGTKAVNYSLNFRSPE